MGSRLIRWGTGSDCSHFAIGFHNIHLNDLVLESTYPEGFRTIPFNKWKVGKKIVHLIQVPIDPKTEYSLYVRCQQALSGKKYDEEAIAYWTTRIVLNKLLFIPMPDDNLWGKVNKIYCVEVLWAIKDWLETQNIKFTKEIEMTSPHDAFEILKRIRVHADV